MSLTKRQIRRGFWYHSPLRRWPPKSVTYPHDKRGDKLNVLCTQLSVNQSEQRRIVKSWCAVLPTLTSVRYLWFSSRVSQVMFDTVCSMPNLEGLYIKWSGIKDISALKSASKLKYLHLGSSPQVERIDCLSELNSLVVLELENIKKISDLGPIGMLHNLEGLAIQGSMYTTQVVESLASLSGLTKLKYLFLTNLKSHDATLRPLSRLNSLVNLQTAFWWPENDFLFLREEMPNLKYGTPFEELPTWAKK